MTTVPIWEQMNLHKSMVKTHGELVEAVRRVVSPVARVIQQFPQTNADSVEGNTYVLVAGSNFAGPFPCAIEHSAVQFEKKLLRQRLSFIKHPF